MGSAEKQQLMELKAFVELCKSTPSVLHKPELSFFKSYLESLGAKIPPAPAEEARPETPEEPKMDKAPSPEDVEVETPESEESDIDLDTSGVVESDDDEPLEVGDASIEVTEEMMEESSEKRSQAMALQSEGKLEESVKAWTEAILKNPTCAVLYAKRANVLLRLQKPNAAIRDADKALEFNPDQPLAYKIRGRANRLLGNWEEAAHDLATACKLDYTDEANEWLKEVMPNAKKLQEHRRKWERKREERELKERQDRIRRAKEEREKEYQRHKEQHGDSPFAGDFPGFPGAGGIGDVLQDPEIMAAFQDPEVAAAFQDISQNPANLAKYQSNPKIKNIMTKMAMKMGGQAPPPTL